MTEATRVHLNPAHARELLGKMILIRRFEEKCAELYSQEKIRGFLHLYIGEEANAVGVMQALTPEDAVVATYREHGHALARGVPPDEIMAEMCGKSGGSCRGRGGSMHIFDAKHRFYGGNAIVGGGLPLAVGLALADKLQGRSRVTCCFFGDGAAAEGEFHESLNLAELWKLPVLFVCENNLYAMGTAIERFESEPSILRHAQSYRIERPASDVGRKSARELGRRGRPLENEVSRSQTPPHVRLRTRTGASRTEAEGLRPVGRGPDKAARDDRSGMLLPCPIRPFEPRTQIIALRMEPHARSLLLTPSSYPLDS